jgi:hypothetical protein
MEKNASVQVENIVLATEMEKRVAFASVRLGDVVVRGIAVWKSPRGKLRVFVPSFKNQYAYEDAISLPSDLQAEVDAAVISAYKAETDRAAQTKNLQQQFREENGKS